MFSHKTPAFRVIAADCATSVSAEMSLPQKPNNLRTWRSDEYTPRKYIEAWRDVFQFVLQNSDLSAGPVRHPATQFVMGYSGQVITGLQLRTSAEHESAVARIARVVWQQLGEAGLFVP